LRNVAFESHNPIIWSTHGVLPSSGNSSTAFPPHESHAAESRLVLVLPEVEGRECRPKEAQSVTRNVEGADLNV